MLLLEDTNAPGTIFGSVIASHIDLASAVGVRKAAPHRFVTMTDGKSDAGMEGAECPIAR
ncbi:MAG: hypothetical protein IT519_09065 [Burkholderiales bacterium]|mgnify:CR=1 FL=1|jgi:acyl-CoA hydrolase|nr:hypothetical protein [Burkholderiales bacterium]